MTNKTTPKLTDTQERAWQMVLDWHKKHGQQIDAFDANSLGRIDGYQVKETTLNALARKGMLIRLSEYKYLYDDYAIHPDFVPEYFDDVPAAPTPEPAPAAAPATVNNAPEYLLGDNVTPTTGEWAGRLCWICDIRHTGVTPMYLIRDKHDKWDTWFGAEELTMVDDPANYQKPAPTSPTYDSLKALADKQDEYIQDLENALRSALVNGKTYLREVDRLGARIAELETENADLRGDMERLAAREMELLQQNSVLFHSLDRIAASQEKLQTAARDACAEYGGDMAEDAMHTLADTIGYPWN